MVRLNIDYQGGLRCLVTHGPSKSQFETDAPLDNHGRAERISPTDLVGAALGSCIATVLGIAAEKHSWDLTGLHVEVDKEMSATPPRRVAALHVRVQMPRPLPDEDRRRVEDIAHACPVHRSLHPDLRVDIAVLWP